MPYLLNIQKQHYNVKSHNKPITISELQINLQKTSKSVVITLIKYR